jgi:hypothetical protein
LGFVKEFGRAGRIEPTRVFRRLMQQHLFTLTEARALLPALHRLTERAIEKIEQLLACDGEDLPAEVEASVRRWASAIVLMGGVPQGLWRVDFDNGQGFWCWDYPEPEVDHVHLYDTSFDERTPIQ